MLILHETGAKNTTAQELAGRGLDIRTSELDADVLGAISDDIDLLIVDIPQAFKALDVTRRIRETSDVPLILLTANATEANVVVGLELGADDFVVRPLRSNVMVARIRAVLRRTSHSRPQANTANGTLVVGPIRLDPLSHEVTVRGKRTRFPLKEFSVLQQFMLNPGRLLPRKTLLHRAWGPNFVDSTGTLDVHIGRIRSRIELDPAHPRLLVNVRGIGFKLDDRVDE